jgi:hypothetical protein
MNEPKTPLTRRLLMWALIAAIAGVVGMILLAIVLVHPALLIFIGGALLPAAIPFAIRHPERLFLSWAAATVTVAAIAPIVTGGLFDPQRPVHTELRSWAIALGASFGGYAIAVLCPWLGERIAVARQKLTAIQFDRRRAELVEIWTETRLRNAPTERATIGKDFVSEEEAPPPAMPTDEEANRPPARAEAGSQSVA